MNNKKRSVSIFWIFGGVIVLGAIVFFLINNFVVPKVQQDFDENNLPKFVQADWIDLSRIEIISKFRSGVGHDFSDFSDPSGEHCRSMKHYFSPEGDNTNDPQKKASLSGSKEPVPSTEPTVDIFSPVDGKITKIDSGAGKTPVGDEVDIRPSNYSNYEFRFQHVYPRGISEGIKVMAGQKIGVIGAHQSVDIILGVDSIGRYRLVSYFEVMPDNVFEKYKQRFGVNSPKDFIISKEFRDAHPLKCVSGSEEFVGGSSSDPNESVTLPK